MYLSPTAINAVVDAVSPPPDGGIFITNEKQQREFLDGWCKKIADANNDCRASVSAPRRGTPSLVIEVRIDVPMSFGYNAGKCLLELDFRNNVLNISKGHWSVGGAPIATLDALWQIIDGIRKKLFEKLARDQKRQKVRELRTHSIEAQIEMLAARMQFAYQLERKLSKVVLVVWMDKRHSLYVDIPLGKLQETIDRLEIMIKQIQDLYAEGLRFKVSGSPYYDEFRQPKPVE